MSVQKPRVAIVGEVLIELAREADGRFRLGYAGDTFNVAVYLARAGIETAFVTALGEDPYSDAVVALATAEGIASDLMLRIRGRLPGLAVLETDGARHSYEWRGEAPVRDLFELPHWGRLAEGLAQAKLVYFSGITLSLYSNVGLGRFLATLEAIRAKGVKMVFDGNFRPRGGGGGLVRAGTVLLGEWTSGSKNGPSSALLDAGGKTELNPVQEVVVAVDSTAAGDGFNAAYIAFRRAG